MSKYPLDDQDYGIECCLIWPQESNEEAGAGENNTASYCLKSP